MKREGRQHGMVKTYPILSAPWDARGPKPRRPNGAIPVPTAGQFAKVPTKPTSHSKFTSKCGRPMCRECHLGPPSKSKAKVKGAQRLRSSSDVASDCRLITWRVVDAKPGLKFSGFSASTVLDFLDSRDEGDDEECDVSQGVELIEDVVEISGAEGVTKFENDEDMSFCDVGFAWEAEEEDEDWCLV